MLGAPNDFKGDQTFPCSRQFHLFTIFEASLKYPTSFLDFTSQLRVRLFFLEEKKPKILEFKNVMIDEERKQKNSLFRHCI